jgi:hypothetical protein
VALRPDVDACELWGEPVTLTEELAGVIDALPPATGEVRSIEGASLGRIAAGEAIVIGPPLAVDHWRTLLSAVPGLVLDSANTVLSLVGPRAEDLLGEAGVGRSDDSLGITRARLVQTEAVLLRQGRGCFTVVAPTASADSLWHHLLRTGRSLGAMPVGCDAIDRLTASQRLAALI